MREGEPRNGDGMTLFGRVVVRRRKHPIPEYVALDRALRDLGAALYDATPIEWLLTRLVRLMERKDR